MVLALGHLFIITLSPLFSPLPHAPRPLGTCSRARLSPSTSRWRRSARSSASSACCCKTWILRFTASMVVIPAIVPTQLLLALGLLPPPLGVAATSHPYFRLLRPEIPELAHPPGCDVTPAVPSHHPAGGKAIHWRQARFALSGERLPSRSGLYQPVKGGGIGQREGYHGNRKVRQCLT